MQKTIPVNLWQQRNRKSTDFQFARKRLLKLSVKLIELSLLYGYVILGLCGLENGTLVLTGFYSWRPLK